MCLVGFGGLFSCERNAALGAEQLLKVFRQIDMTRETFEARPFTRLKQVQHLLRTGQIDESMFWRNALNASVVGA